MVHTKSSEKEIISDRVHLQVPIKILIADTAPDIHETACLTLSDFKFENRPLQILSSYNGEQTIEILKRDNDIAVILLDDAMATRPGGPSIVNIIREDFKNIFIRIILRLDHGSITEKEAVHAYDINGCISKEELTSKRLFITIYSSLRTHRDMVLLENKRLEALRKQNTADDKNPQRAWYQSVPMMIHFADENGRLIDVNEQWLTTMGYRREDVIGRFSSDFFANGSTTYAKSRTSPEPCDNGKAFGMPCQMVTKDGKIIDVFSSAILDPEDDKSGLFFTAVNENITLQCRAEQAEKRFRNVALASGDWIWEIDKSGRYTYASQSVKNLLGFEPEELLGKTPFDLMPSEESERVRKAVHSSVDKQAPIAEFENWNKTKAGEPVCMLTNGVPLINRNGVLYGYLGVNKDITDQKKSQEKLEQTVGDLTALNRMSREINSELSLDGVLKKAVVPITDAIQPAIALILLQNEDKLEVMQQYSFDPMILDVTDPTVLDTGKPVCRNAFKDQRAFFTTDIAREPGCGKPAAGLTVIRGFAAIPLIFGQEAIGVMAVGCLTPRRFDERKDFLFSIADILAAGINKSFLHEQIRRYAEHLERSVEIRTGELTRTNKLLKKEIDERNAMAAELEKREEMLNRTGAMARVGGWELDLAGNELVWSRTVYDIHQVAQDYTPRVETAIDFYVPEHRERIHRLIDKCRRQGAGYDEEFEIVNAGGKKIWVRAKGEPVYENGQIVKLIGSFQDISDKKKSEAELLMAKDEAEEASQAKTEFLARMSHEIRTPMNAIINLTDFLFSTGLDAEQRDYLNVVKQSGLHLLNIINNILDLSKIESRHMELEDTTFDLAGVLETTVASLTQQANDKGLFLELNIEEDLQTCFAGDPGRLQQVLLNLAGNALKFTQTGGIIISVSGSPIPSEAEKTKYRLLFRIEDTGIGILETHKTIIFEAFSQADVSTSRKFGGTGLGLTISKQLIELMGGEIWFTSEPGQGTAFHFNICLAKGNPMNIAADTGSKWEFSPSREEPSRILMAEDNSANVKVANAVIRKLGHHLTVAANGREAMEMLQQEDFDLVLMDVEMPVMDGLTTTRKIRQGLAGKNNQDIRIIALTAHAFTGYREKCLAAGMDHYISKPFNPGELAEVIGQVQKGEPASPASLPDKQTGSENALILDSKTAIKRLYNDSKLYDSLCIDFLKKIAGQTDTLRESINKKEFDKAAILAHTLKGNCGNIGAIVCEKAAGKLESALREKTPDEAGRYLSEMTAAMDDVRNILYNSLHPLHPKFDPDEGEPPADKTEVSDASFKQNLQSLKKTLEKGQVDEKLMDCVSIGWPSGTDPALLAQIKNAVDEFDFAGALAKLDCIETENNGISTRT